MKKILIVAGGWDGHRPLEFAQLIAKLMETHGYAVDVETSLEVFSDRPKLSEYALIVPCWTMGQLNKTQGDNLQSAVKSGVGLGGIHGGMGDAFRGNLEYEWMVGGHFVGHPYVGDYTVTLRDLAHPITAGISREFPYQSEQYYLLVDPGIHVLADTLYQHEGRSVSMPVAWTKTWGNGRVFYHSLGHRPEEFDQFPAAKTLTERGLLWAAGVL